LTSVYLSILLWDSTPTEGGLFRRGRAPFNSPLRFYEISLIIVIWWRSGLSILLWDSTTVCCLQEVSISIVLSILLWDSTKARETGRDMKTIAFNSPLRFYQGISALRFHAQHGSFNSPLRFYIKFLNMDAYASTALSILLWDSTPIVQMLKNTQATFNSPLRFYTWRNCWQLAIVPLSILLWDSTWWGCRSERCGWNHLSILLWDSTPCDVQALRCSGGLSILLWDST